MIDFHQVPADQRCIDDGLRNWANWVKPRRPSWISPMFRMARSNSRQWHTPEIRDDVFPLLAEQMEKAVANLPMSHRAVIRWAYVFQHSPARECRQLGISMDSLRELLNGARRLLIRDGALRYCPNQNQALECAH